MSSIVTDDTTAVGTLRSAILAANADPNPDTFDIEFSIPASTAADLNVPFEGFDPITQTWQITLNSALPVITHAVSIDGYSQANNALPYRYPDESSSAVQLLAINGLADGRDVHTDHGGTAACRNGNDCLRRHGCPGAEHARIRHRSR